MAKVIGCCGVLLLAGGPAMGAGGEGLAEVETTLEKWVETRELVSRTRVQWSTDREMLEQTVMLLERELSAVQAQAAGLGTNSAQVEKERRQAEAQLKEAGESLDRSPQASFARQNTHFFWLHKHNTATTRPSTFIAPLLTFLLTVR